MKGSKHVCYYATGLDGRHIVYHIARWLVVVAARIPALPQPRQNELVLWLQCC